MAPRIGHIEVRARIETVARKLARSGRYEGFSSIEMALLTRGYPQMPKVFANRWTQSELDRLCKLARLQSGKEVSADLA
jgi:hypothetical protein